MKLLALATHPIQYQAPWWRALAADPRIELTVAFGFLPGAEAQGVGFGVPFVWDVPLLDGYRSLRLESSAASPSLGRFFGVRARGLRRLMRLEAPDAVLLTGWNSWVLLQGLAAARSLGIPTLVRGDSNDLHQRPWVVRWLQRRLLARYQAALAVGRANRDFLVARGIGPEKIFDAPHFVDNDAIAGAADRERSQRGDLRRRWGIAPGEVCFLFAGKLIGKKRPGDLLDAFSMSPELQLGTRLLIVGDGELRSALESRAASQRLPVEFAGFLNQSEMPRSFAAADLLVLPSDAGETWGLVVNEAMAGGIPAIVSDRVGCGLDLIVEGETGWTFPCGDVRALASAMRAAAADPHALRRMGGAARRRVLERFTIEQSVEATVSALRYLSERRR